RPLETWWQIWWRIRGFSGIGGVKNSQDSSRLLILQPLAPISNPSLSARSIIYVDSISTSPFARTKNEAKSAVGSPAPSCRSTRGLPLPPPLEPGCRTESRFAGAKSSNALRPMHRVRGGAGSRRQRKHLGGYQ